MISLKEITLDENGVITINDPELLDYITGGNESTSSSQISVNVGTCVNAGNCREGLDLGQCLPK